MDRERCSFAGEEGSMAPLQIAVNKRTTVGLGEVVGLEDVIQLVFLEAFFVITAVRKIV